MMLPSVKLEDTLDLHAHSLCVCPPLQDFLETLEDLDLSYNNLVDIPWETIALLVSVNTLSLDHNLIESVPEGIFSNLHKLARSGPQTLPVSHSLSLPASCHLQIKRHLHNCQFNALPVNIQPCTGRWCNVQLQPCL